MVLVSPLVALAALGCALASNPERATPQAGDALPPARQALSIPAGAETSLDDLLERFAASTGHVLVVSDHARSMLTNSSVDLRQPAEVPAEDVYAFVEGILAHHQVVLVQLKGGERPMLGVYPLSGASSLPYAAWLPVPAPVLPRYRDHAALLVQSAVHLPGLDVRPAATSLRGLLRDVNHQALLPIGQHTMVLRGTGRFVAEMARLLRETERAALEAQAAETPSVDGDAGGEAR